MSRVIFLSAALCGLSSESCPYCYTLSVCKDTDYFLIHKERRLKNPFVNCLLCRERDSNPHSCNSQGILSPSCLPFHHRGDLSGCKGTKKIYASQILFGLFTFYLCRNTLRCPYGPVVEAAYFSNPVSPSCPFCNTPPEFMS